MSEEVVSTQPSKAAVVLKTDITGQGSVTVRNLLDTPEDCTFAGKILVEGFRAKTVHATSERSLPQVAECKAKFHRGQMPEFYQRQFVAEYCGEKAGLLGIKFHSDPKERDNGAFNSLKCCDKISMHCINMVSSLEPSDIPAHQCLLDHICVDSKFRGKGIGQVLMQVAEKEARKEGCESIYLFVATSNRAIHLYEREGYKVTDTATGCGCLIWCLAGERAFHRMEKQLS